MRRRGSPILLRLLAYAFPYWRMVLVAWFFVFGAAAFMVLMPVLVRIAIDTGLDFKDGVPTGEKSTLVWFGVGIVAISVLRGGFAYGQTYVTHTTYGMTFTTICSA